MCEKRYYFWRFPGTQARPSYVAVCSCWQNFLAQSRLGKVRQATLRCRSQPSCFWGSRNWGPFGANAPCNAPCRQTCCDWYAHDALPDLCQTFVLWKASPKPACFAPSCCYDLDFSAIRTGILLIGYLFWIYFWAGCLACDSRGLDW